MNRNRNPMNLRAAAEAIAVPGGDFMAIVGLAAAAGAEVVPPAVTAMQVIDAEVAQQRNAAAEAAQL